MARGIAYIDIAPEVLKQFLPLPLDCEILGSERKEDSTVRLMIEADDIPDDARVVTLIARSIHGVTVFDRFDVVQHREAING